MQIVERPFSGGQEFKKKVFFNLGIMLTIWPTNSMKTQNSSNSIRTQTHSLKSSTKPLTDTNWKDRGPLIFPLIRFLTGCNSQLNKSSIQKSWDPYCKILVRGGWFKRHNSIPYSSWQTFHLNRCCLKTGALCMFEYNEFLMAVQ